MNLPEGLPKGIVQGSTPGVSTRTPCLRLPLGESPIRTVPFRSTLLSYGFEVAVPTVDPHLSVVDASARQWP